MESDNVHWVDTAGLLSFVYFFSFSLTSAYRSLVLNRMLPNICPIAMGIALGRCVLSRLQLANGGHCTVYGSVPNIHVRRLWTLYLRYYTTRIRYRGRGPIRRSSRVCPNRSRRSRTTDTS